MLVSIDQELSFIFAFVCNYHGVTASKMINSSTCYLWWQTDGVAFAITKAQICTKIQTSNSPIQCSVLWCWECTSGKSGKGVVCLWGLSTATGVFTEFSHGWMPSQITTRHSADSRDVIWAKALHWSQFISALLRKGFRKCFALVFYLWGSKKPFSRVNLEKAGLKTTANQYFLLENLLFPHRFCPPSLPPSLHSPFSQAFRGVRCPLTLPVCAAWGADLRCVVQGRHQLDSRLGLTRDVQVTVRLGNSYCARVVFNLGGTWARSLLSEEFKDARLSCSVSVYCRCLILYTCISKESLPSSVTQKHFVDESAAKKMCKLSTLLRAPELCVCVRVSRWCRAVCTVELQSERIFKVLSLPKLQFSLLCLNFTAIFLQYSDTYISGDVLYQSCKTACNSPGSSVVFYASVSIKELQSFQVCPMGTK